MDNLCFLQILLNYTYLRIFVKYTEKLISRRYKQFDWLHTQLIEKYPCIAIPPLPNKQVVGNIWKLHYIYF